MRREGLVEVGSRLTVLRVCMATSLIRCQWDPTLTGMIPSVGDGGYFPMEYANQNNVEHKLPAERVREFLRESLRTGLALSLSRAFEPGAKWHNLTVRVLVL